MEKVEKYDNVLFAVTPNHRLTVLISGPPELVDKMTGDLFDDNSLPETLNRFPQEPGVYRATIEYWFEQGYFEGVESRR